eukprot:138585_1
MMLLYAILIICCVYGADENKKIKIFSSMFICLPSEEVTHKYLSKIINDFNDYEIYILRPNCCSDIIEYNDNNNIHLLDVDNNNNGNSALNLMTENDNNNNIHMLDVNNNHNNNILNL